jgi:hypothetical protein
LGRVVLIVHGSTQGSCAAAALWSSIFAWFRVIVAETKNVVGITLSSALRRKLANGGYKL